MSDEPTTETPAEETTAVEPETPAVPASEETTPAETPAAKEGEPEKVEAKPEDKPAEQAEITEEALRVAAVRFANKTMAAARRRADKAEALETKHAETAQSLEVHKAFVEQLRNPATTLQALARIGIGDGTTRGFLDHRVGHADEQQPSVEDRLTRFEKAQVEREARQAREVLVARIDATIESKIDTDKAKYSRVNTNFGKQQLWAAINAFHEINQGQVTPAHVLQLAEETERSLRAEFGDPQLPPARQGEKNDAPAAAQAAPAARTSGKTIAGRSSAGAPVVREYSNDPEERRRQVTEDMRAAGEL